MQMLDAETASSIMLLMAALAAACLLSVVRRSRPNDLDVNRLRKQVRKLPRNPHLRFDFGLALYCEGKLDEAEHQFQEALLINHKNAKAQHYIGMIKMMQGDCAAAEERFLEATILCPTFAEAYANLGSAREMRGDLIGAEGAHQRAVRINPKLAIAHYNLARVYATCFECPKAVTHLELAIRLNKIYKEEAKSCGDFDRIVHHSTFQNLIYGRAA
jgi:tetratricopeptide (TPR) repeat protein